MVEYAIWMKKCSVMLNNCQIMKDCSLRIKKGATVALWGRAGSGKKVLTKLMMGIYKFEEIEGSKAYILGYDLTRINLAELRANIVNLEA